MNVGLLVIRGIILVGKAQQRASKNGMKRTKISVVSINIVLMLKNISKK